MQLSQLFPFQVGKLKPYQFPREPARVLQRADTELHHRTKKWQGDHSSVNSMFSSAPHCAMLLRAMVVKKL
ncbi:hypothetical protein B0T13DRAFT_458725 [Neurospora crassa]|nr:hypothetical protein B0T13DRAFT_458725 [Neurospora crassa]